MYADLLNRMRTNIHTKEDIEELRKRIYKTDHPIYKQVELYVVCKKILALKINTDFLLKQKGEELILQATHTHALQAKYKPMISDVGVVGETGFIDELKVKLGCKLMLIQNLDVADCLTNGQLGTLIAIIKAKNGSVKMLIVDFKNKEVGKRWREEHPGLAAQYPTGTGIEKSSHTYGLTNKSQANITVIQYPLILA